MSKKLVHKKLSATEVRRRHSEVCIYKVTRNEKTNEIKSNIAAIAVTQTGKPIFQIVKS